MLTVSEIEYTRNLAGEKTFNTLLEHIALFHNGPRIYRTKGVIKLIDFFYRMVAKHNLLFLKPSYRGCYYD
jgi:hypothetical protein